VLKAGGNLWGGEEGGALWNCMGGCACDGATGKVMKGFFVGVKEGVSRRRRTAVFCCLAEVPGTWRDVPFVLEEKRVSQVLERWHRSRGEG